MVDPVLDDDDDEKWVGYPGHTRAKHELLKYYLDIWFRVLGHPQYNLRIFDCFAGRGEYYPEDQDEPLEIENLNQEADFPGSPQAILDVASEHSHQAGQIDCVFIDYKQKNARLLSENLPPSSELPENVDYQIVNGKFQDKATEMITETGGWSVPTFFFMDPFGYKPLEYDIVTQLASRDRFEVLINLMASEVVRWQDTEKHHEAHQTLFGTDDWHTELEQFEPEMWQKEVGYYCERLEEKGPDHTIAYLVTEENSSKMKYYLVFGTNDETGVEKMRSAMQRKGTG
ncbi:MAG: three-Cys-motif partner protein TcmP, partial [Halobacteriaceae archaeon]